MSDQHQPFSSEEELALLGFYSPMPATDLPADSSVHETQNQSSLEVDQEFVSPAENVEEMIKTQEIEDDHEQLDDVVHEQVEAVVVSEPFVNSANTETISPEQPTTEKIIPEESIQEESIRDRALSMVDHLDDLRKRLIYTLVAFVVSLILSLFFVQDIFRFLTAPLGNVKLTVLGPAEIIHVYFIIGGLAALVPTIPFLMWQIWLFVSPGLTKEERKATLTYIPAVLIVFLGGVAFGRFLVFPALMRVLTGFSTAYTNYMPTADAYFSFMINLLVPFGFIFEMPIIVMFLTRLGLLNPMRLVKFRKYAYFVIVVISFMLTPPEITTHLSLTIPMILLYEISIQISRYAQKKRLLSLQAQSV